MNTENQVFIAKTTDGIKSAVTRVLTQIDRARPILKSSQEVYIKVNGVHSKSHCYTSPEVLRAVIEHCQAIGARKVYVMEDTSIGNVTRLVFSLTGFDRICKETGAKPIYLDEDKAEVVRLNDEIRIEVPRTVARIVAERDSVTYINLPKLKTHNDTVVTLGIKNQFGFVSHQDRMRYHDERLHSVLADLYRYIQPDITLIDAIEAISGQLPLTAYKDLLVERMDLVLGGRDTLAVDTVGARMLGYSVDEVPHLGIARLRGLGEGNLSRIALAGDVISLPDRKIAWKLPEQFPEDIKIIRGTRKICLEGCETNTLVVIQMLVYDHQGKGGFFVLMGQGFGEGLIERLKAEGFTRGLISGHCAIEEVGTEFVKAFGKRNIYLSGDCCNVAELVSSVTKLTGRSTFDLAPTAAWKTLYMFVSAKLHGSRSVLAKLF